MYNLVRTPVVHRMWEIHCGLIYYYICRYLVLAGKSLTALMRQQCTDMIRTYITEIMPLIPLPDQPWLGHVLIVCKWWAETESASYINQRYFQLRLCQLSAGWLKKTAESCQNTWTESFWVMWIENRYEWTTLPFWPLREWPYSFTVVPLYVYVYVGVSCMYICISIVPCSL